MQVAHFVPGLLEFLSDLEAEGHWLFFRAWQSALQAVGPHFTPVLGFTRNWRSLGL